MHRVVHKSITLSNGDKVDLSYWCDQDSVYVAAFDRSGKQVSAVIYSAKAILANDFSNAFQQSLIDGLAETVESDLTDNPQMHYRP